MKPLLYTIISFFIGCGSKAVTNEQNPSNENSSNYIFADKNVSDSLNLTILDSLTYSFSFNHIDKKDSKLSYNYKGEVKNIDPEGLNSMDLFDPTGEDNPTEVFLFEDPKIKFFIYIPLIETPIVGINLKPKVENQNSKSTYRRNLTRR